MSNINVLFVCLGNICRSPTAEGVFTKMVEDADLTEQIRIDSAGTAAWHIGKGPDPRSVAAGAKRGFNFAHLKARQAVTSDFEKFDYVLAMDESNYEDLSDIAPNGKAPILFLKRFGGNPDHQEVPDPYYGGENGFELVLDLLEDACSNLLEEIKRDLL